MYKFLITWEILFIFIALCAGLWRYRYLTANLKVALLLIVFDFITEVGVFIVHLFVHNVNFIYYAIGPIEYVLIACFFLSLTNNMLIKTAIRISIPLSLLFATVNYIFWQHPPTAATNFTVLKGALVTICALACFMQLFLSRSSVHCINYSETIICAGVLTYFSFSVVYWSLQRYLAIHKDNNLPIFLKIIPFLSIMNIVMYIAYAIGFALVKKPYNNKLL